MQYNQHDVYQFGTISVVSLSEVKFKARQLGFVVTLGSRNSRVVERIGFGLEKPMRRDLRDHSFPHEPVTLFTFNMHNDGFFHAGRKNKMNISICNEMINNYRKITNAFVVSSSRETEKLDCGWCQHLDFRKMQRQSPNLSTDCILPKWAPYESRNSDRPSLHSSHVFKQMGKDVPWYIGRQPQYSILWTSS